MGYSILFDDISCLHPSLQRELNDYIEGTNMARRHRLYATSSVDLAHLVKNNQFSLPLYRSFCGFTINLKPLALTPELILPLAAEILEWISKKFSKDCGGFEDEAKALLQEFPWPLNIIQLVAVLQQLVINSDGFIITTELTKQVLDKETPKEYVPSTMFDLTKPLAEIVCIARVKHESLSCGKTSWYWSLYSLEKNNQPAVTASVLFKYHECPEDYE